MLGKRVSKNVKLIRQTQDLSQKELADRSGLTVRYISRLENSPQNITLDVVERLAKGLNCDPSDILGKEQVNSQINERSKEAKQRIDEAMKILKEIKSKI